MIPLSLPGVYAPQDDTDLLVHALRREPLAPRARVLDVGTGTGAVALAAARRGALVTAVDISWRAVLNTKVNAVLSRLPMTVVRGNLLAPVAGRSFDLILSNPPYVPGPGPSPGLGQRLGQGPGRGRGRGRGPGPGSGRGPGFAGFGSVRGDARAWEAGWDGRLVLDRICRDSPSLLRPGGVLLLVQSALSDAERTLAQLRAEGLRAEIVDHRRVAFGPVLRSRSDWLRGRGFLGDEAERDGAGGSGDGDGDGDEKEELVIIRAERPR